jgi:hypothetical protein
MNHEEQVNFVLEHIDDASKKATATHPFGDNDLLTAIIVARGVESRDQAKLAAAKKIKVTK